MQYSLLLIGLSVEFRIGEADPGVYQKYTQESDFKQNIVLKYIVNIFSPCILIHP